MPLTGINSTPPPQLRYILPLSVWEDSLGEFRGRLREGTEGQVFWLGAVRGQVATVSRFWKPRSQASSFGVLAPASEVASMLFDAREHSELILAQVHSHLGQAFHSTVDDAGAVSLRVGFLSVVVPLGGCIKDVVEAVVFEHIGGERWRKWGVQEIEARVRIAADL